MKKQTIIILKLCIIIREYVYKLYFNQRNYTQRCVKSSNKANEIQLSLNKKIGKEIKINLI